MARLLTLICNSGEAAVMIGHILVPGLLCVPPDALWPSRRPGFCFIQPSARYRRLHRLRHFYAGSQRHLDDSQTSAAQLLSQLEEWRSRSATCFSRSATCSSVRCAESATLPAKRAAGLQRFGSHLGAAGFPPRSGAGSGALVSWLPAELSALGPGLRLHGEPCLAGCCRA